MTREELRGILDDATYWHLDRFGSYRAQLGTRTYRLRIQQNSLRLERQLRYSATEYSPASTSWIRVDSAYLKDVALTSEGLRLGRASVRL